MLQSDEWITEEQKRPYHPLSNTFPLMSEIEYEQLRLSISSLGLLESILLHPDGSIIDGRNRHRACMELGIKPTFKTWDGQGSLLMLIISLNLDRRHLTSSQRAAIAIEILPGLEEEAKEREKAGGIMTQQGTEIFPYPEEEKGEAREQAAFLFNTNPHYISDAKMLHAKALDLFAQVKNGKLTISQAKREYTKRTKVLPPPLEGKYRVIYADPPWAYNDSGIINDDNYGRVERHYPSMSLTEICDLGEQIQDILETDAVLFMWTTTPLLEDAFRVVKAWGFKYKTEFVWDKVKHNFGHYNSVRHEHLFICTRGSCTPDHLELFDSVQSIERSDEHSEKPEEFREIIDTLYPHGNRIELFARTRKTGWEIWGNESV